MIFPVDLQPGTTLANVVYRWTAAGAIGAELATGITQPWSDVPVFRIDATPPADAESLVVYDSMDHSNWNDGGYALAKLLSSLGSAQQILLTQLWTPTSASQTIVPANAPDLSIARCFGTWKNVSASDLDGIPVTFTLVAQDDSDPTIIYDLTATPLKNTETSSLIGQRVVNASLVGGQIQDVNGNTYVDLVRTDFIVAGADTPLPVGSHLTYLLGCTELGAPSGFQILAETETPPVPVTFQLNTTTLLQTSSGTFDLAKKVVS
jgi:hypothetical protein